MLRLSSNRDQPMPLGSGRRKPKADKRQPVTASEAAMHALGFSTELADAHDRVDYVLQNIGPNSEIRTALTRIRTALASAKLSAVHFVGHVLQGMDDQEARAIAELSNRPAIKP